MKINFKFLIILLSLGIYFVFAEKIPQCTLNYKSDSKHLAFIEKKMKELTMDIDITGSV